jgi:hypothetical protein
MIDGKTGGEVNKLMVLEHHMYKFYLMADVYVDF